MNRRLTQFCLTLFLILGVVSEAAAFAYTNFSPIDVPGAIFTFATGINDQEEVVGFYSDGSREHGFFYDGTSFRTIDIPNSTADARF